jgi:hypothetical protein
VLQAADKEISLLKAKAEKVKGAEEGVDAGVVDGEGEVKKSKTQYLFRINKGINNSYDNQEINKFMPDNERYIPFKQMIYLGDGETDVPAMKMIKYQGGKAVAVYNPKVRAKKGKKSPKQICEDLIIQNRADYIVPANYSEGSELDKLLKLIIDKIAAEVELKKFEK